MARFASKDVDQLKPRLARLALLDGTPVLLADGLHLTWVDRIRDARAIVAGCRRGALTSSLLRTSATLRRDPLPVTAAWLAACQRDLLAVAGSPYRLRLAREARPLRHIADVDGGWLADRQRRIDALSARLHASPPTSAPDAIHPTVLELVRAVHGDEGTAALLSLVPASLELARETQPGWAETFAAGPFAGGLVEAAETWGLWFRPAAGDRLSPDDVALALRDLDVGASLAEHSLPLRTALDLAPLRLRAKARTFAPLARLVAAGLPLDEVLSAERLGSLWELSRLRDAAVARAWCAWMRQLVPEHRAAGIQLRLPPQTFERAAAGRGSELAALAECLLAHRDAPRVPLDRRLATLDAVLGLFRSAPCEARGLASVLRSTAPGEGRRLFPAFAAWLEDDALLDRFVHVQRLAEREPSLSRALLADFRWSERVGGQIEHLAALPTPTAEQARRLAHLRHVFSTGERTPARTRRRLQEAVETEQQPAFLRQLERVLRAVLKRVWGVAPQRIDDAWLDAVRFHPRAGANKRLLAQLVQHAAAHPGRPIHRSLAANRQWLERARPHLDVDAWLAHNERVLEVGGRRYRLATEEDPLQVLRMGIPFDTCLALEEGYNAAATVLNAMDANKRVLYLRDERGTIVGRKLIAISSDWKLVGYRVYLALDSEFQAEVEAGFRLLCEEIANAAGLTLAATGAPEQIHEGFWYDDGTVPFDGGTDAERRYCEHLGVPLVRMYDLGQEAKGWLARERGDAQAALAALDDMPGGPASAALADWVVSRLPSPEAMRRAKTSGSLCKALFRRAAATSIEAVLDLFARLGGTDLAWYGAEPWISSVPPRPGLATSIVRTARRWAGRTLYVGTIEAYIVDELPVLASAEPPRDLLALCDAVEPILAAAAHTSSSAAELVAKTRSRLRLAAELAHDARPDVAAVQECLRSRRRSALAREVARHLAGRYSLLQGISASDPDPLASLRDGAAEEVAVAEAVRTLAGKDMDVLIAALGVRLLVRSGRDPGRFGPLRSLAARADLVPETLLALLNSAALRDEVGLAQAISARAAEPLLRRLRAAAISAGLDGDALVRSVIGAAVTHTDLGWIRDLESVSLLREVMDVALASAPAIAVEVLAELPDAWTAAPFVREVASRFGSGALETVKVPDHDGGRQRERWLRHACAAPAR